MKGQFYICTVKFYLNMLISHEKKIKYFISCYLEKYLRKNILIVNHPIKIDVISRELSDYQISSTVVPLL